MFRFEDTEETRFANFNIRRILNIRSLIKNRKSFKTSSRKWNIYNTNWTTRYYKGLVEQHGSNLQRKERVNYFQGETYKTLLAIKVLGKLQQFKFRKNWFSISVKCIFVNDSQTTFVDNG